MEAGLRYAAPSQLRPEGQGEALELSPNLLRDPTRLVARVTQPLELRDALLALHDVARSELFVSQAEVERRQLDPVVTVTPEEVYFESFSRDESTYGRVTVRPAALDEVEELRFGTTNVEFSRRLVQGLETVRSATRLGLRVSTDGIALEADDRRVAEEKIELPDSWVHGFLAVAATLPRPAVALDLHPGDLRNVITFLRQRKETTSPRSLRFRLAPGKPPSVLVEPWNETIALPRSSSDAREEREVRVWGRRRLLLLHKALPGASAVRALLQGSGQPSFWTVERGAVALTLGLSPWTEREWAGLEPLPLAAEGELAADVERAALALEERRRTSPAALAAALQVTEPAARAALDLLCREGRALYDREEDRYVARRLFLGAPPPPPAPAEREKAARAIVAKGGVTLGEVAPATEGGRVARARVKGNGTYEVTAVLDLAERLTGGICACPFFARQGLLRGPCKHLLALAQAAAEPGRGAGSTA